MGETSSYASGGLAINLSFVISVLVTEIQWRRVCGVKDIFQPKDLVWLDSCDKHKNDGPFGENGGVSVQSPFRKSRAALKSRLLRGGSCRAVFFDSKSPQRSLAR
ncbi:hypothetical protein E2F50_05485 [Rhizobium deserti]|uniref:Uncharacterized protein n=1 Tax=Rhizobium deserti TaxID=2547961 RepID=A0A4R5UP60_9HYPH|nr:hypothetical protein E2F50_05485 [Rhizobium deserti]